MKTFVLMVTLLSINAFSAISNEVDYSCIANKLQASNSSIYYNLSDSEIDAMLTIPEMMGHLDAVNAATFCAKKENLNLTCNGNLEAEFIGSVTSVNYSAPEAGNIEHTTFGISNFTFFSENALCPLDDQLALKASFWIQGQVNLKNGDPISGVLIYNPRTQLFSIE